MISMPTNGPFIKTTFCPSMKLKEKKRINSKYYKKYDPPRTPYDRVMASEHVSDKKKNGCKQFTMRLIPLYSKRILRRNFE